MMTVFTIALVMSTVLYFSFYFWVIPKSIQEAPLNFKLQELDDFISAETSGFRA